MEKETIFMNLIYLLSKMNKAQMGGPNDADNPIQILPEYIVYE